ncbi:hypothetical protein ALC56_07631 [Trachymyrmex septentrionalis]|uniref:Fibronectin type-III domain-containing protein n=1 Tax=Trachymyrmex septentrionalis TaxID=34720 RepID=A0A195FCS9_9HYME|nr:hypothetical protein ALC56_07631 [Trachymyrmex septentrionalis]
MKFQQCDHDEVIQIIRSTKRGMRGGVLARAPGFVLSHKGPRKSTVNRIDISNEERRARSEKDDDSILREVGDVPDPPERPLVISYTSKAVNISWAPGVNSHNTPISQYVIYTRKLNYKIPDWLDPLEAHFAEKTGISQLDSQRDNNI